MLQSDSGIAPNQPRVSQQVSTNKQGSLHVRTPTPIQRPRSFPTSSTDFRTPSLSQPLGTKKINEFGVSCLRRSFPPSETERAPQNAEKRALSKISPQPPRPPPQKKKKNGANRETPNFSSQPNHPPQKKYKKTCQNREPPKTASRNQPPPAESRPGCGSPRSRRCSAAGPRRTPPPGAAAPVVSSSRPNAQAGLTYSWFGYTSVHFHQHLAIWVSLFWLQR